MNFIFDAWLNRNVENLLNPFPQRQTSLLKQLKDLLCFGIGMNPDYHLLTEKPALKGRGYLLHNHEMIEAFRQSLDQKDWWDPGEMEMAVIQFLEELFPDDPQLVEEHLKSVKPIQALMNAVPDLKRLLIVRSFRALDEGETCAFNRLKEDILTVMQDLPESYDECSRSMIYLQSFRERERLNPFIERTARIDLCLRYRGLLDSKPQVLYIPKDSIVGFRF